MKDLVSVMEQVKGRVWVNMRKIVSVMELAMVTVLWVLVRMMELFKLRVLVTVMELFRLRVLVKMRELVSVMKLMPMKRKLVKNMAAPAEVTADKEVVKDVDKGVGSKKMNAKDIDDCKEG
ncbi:hypothetical protein VNO78_27140 [Psophocarpus tetragonolobus]|uniref:Uncharacterized protein n=1 Tax=Psophocarpus tetragonolobus TaxID=3891 RepID=A0AAN9XBT2_PSOTE